jgi:C-terminal processing protease CtpA/Prc
VLFAALAVFQWSGCVSPSRLVEDAAAMPGESTALARRFDRVDQLVRTRYYSRDFNGVAWGELCELYRPLAAQAQSDAAWYSLVNEMLRELDDVHTRACGPMARDGKTSREEGGSSFVNSGRVSRVLEGGVVYLRFGHFDSESVRWLAAQIGAHQKAPGMILDLRHNPGGLVTCAQRAVGLFFEKRVPMGWVVGRDGRRSMERSRPTANRRYPGRLAVLVGPNSRSSAEVFAYVMQHHKRATIVGRPTAGQVLGARPYRLPDGGNLYVSISDFQRFDQGRLEGEGVRPDVLVRAATAVAAECSDELSDDPALAAAFDVVQSTKGTQVARRD